MIEQAFDHGLRKKSHDDGKQQRWEWVVAFPVLDVNQMRQGYANYAIQSDHD